MIDVRTYTSAEHPEAIYQALLDHGVFGLPVCDDCGRAHYPPRLVCPSCGSTGLHWDTQDGVGTVYSVSVLSPRDAEAYAVILVDLDVGPRLMSNLVGIEADEATIGMRVRVQIGERAGAAVPLFMRLHDEPS